MYTANCFPDCQSDSDWNCYKHCFVARAIAYTPVCCLFDTLNLEADPLS